MECRRTAAVQDFDILPLKSAGIRRASYFETLNKSEISNKTILHIDGLLINTRRSRWAYAEATGSISPC